jgi:uncharacterized membrane protein YjgN (DUF898 family)
MESTSTLICPQCAWCSLTPGTCSQCGTAFSTPPLESSASLPVSDELTAPLSESEVPSSAFAPTDLDPAPVNGQEGQPPSTGPVKPTDSSDSTIYHPIFWGRGETLFGIFIVNTLYTLLTLGIYSFWGRVRIRQFLSSQTSFATIRFSYHGTALELLKGWGKAFVIFGVPYGFLSLVPIIWDQVPAWIPNALATLMVLCFIPVAVVGSQRYRLSRTALGAIRFSFRGHVKDYMNIWFTGTFLTFITAGIYYPFFENARREFLTSQTYLGNRNFTYKGTGMALSGIYGKALGVLIGILLVTTLVLIKVSGIPLTPEFLTYMADWLNDVEHHAWLAGGIFLNLATFMWSWFYLQVTKQRYFWNHSAFDNAPFQFTASTWNLMELRWTNFFMLVLTFGLAWPWVQVRNLQFLYYYLGLQGPLAIHQIEQEALDASPTGEELAGYFDAGFDLG